MERSETRLKKTKKKGRIGSSFDDFLREECIYEEVTARAVKRVIARQHENHLDIDHALVVEAQRACGLATKKETVEQALRLMIRLHRQKEVGAAFGKYRWRGNLAASRRGRGAR